MLVNTGGATTGGTGERGTRDVDPPRGLKRVASVCGGIERIP